MADIRNLTVLPRPRSAWQAMDAGFTLARAHYVPLVLMWLGFSLPVFILCSLIQLWLGWGYMLFVWWWFKPLYELPMLFFISKAVFSESITVKEAWKLTVSNFWTLFKTYLSVARFSTARAMSFSVVFLEMLPRKQRASRIQTLSAVKTRHYLLMMACLHIEYILAYALITFFGLMFFSSSIGEFDWSTILVTLESPASQKWIVAISITTVVAAGLVAPFYVAGGFLIYINRRMQLEAWDIEHRFRKIKPRAGKTTGLASLVLACALVFSSDPSTAEQRAQSLMTPAAATTSIDAILSDPDFGSTQTQLVPKFKFDNEDDNDDDDDEKFDFSWLERFADSASSLASGFQIILWIAAAIFLGLLLYTLTQFRFKSRTPSALSRQRKTGEDAQSHPLTQDLPSNIVATAERLLELGDRRQALSVLFRGALRSVMDEHELKIASGATEADCQTNVAAVGTKQQSQTFTNLIQVWQKEAYANQPQSEDDIRALITQWKSAFSLRLPTDNGSAVS